MSIILLILILYKPILLIIGLLLLKYLVKKYLNRDIEYIKWILWIYNIIKDGFSNIIRIFKKND